MKNLFFDLTPDIVLKAVESEGYSPSGHCMALNSYENRVFDVRLEDDSHIIAKFYRPRRWKRQQIQEEHHFLFQLKNEEIPVCAPLLFADGTSVHETSGIMYAFWSRTGGRAADEFSDEDLRTLGSLLARIHNMGDMEKAEHRIALTGESYGLEPLAYLTGNGFLPERCRERYRRVAAEIAAVYESMRSEIPFLRIHGDCHPGNLLRDGRSFYFLDFDDFLMGPAVQDIWMLVPARDTEGIRQRNVFLDSYRVFRDFDDSWLRLIEPLRSLRYIHYAAWIARRWDDPAFKNAFAWFGTEEYWMNETADLEDQLDFIHGASPEFSHSLKDEEQPGEEKELTNADFFWDWDGK